MLYTERFNQNFKGLEEKFYFKNLGINTLHLMPFFDVPEPENDGGYAVKTRKNQWKLGTMEDFENLAKISIKWNERHHGFCAESLCRYSSMGNKKLKR